MNAVLGQPSHVDLDFVRTHVRRIAENMGVDQVYQDLAVFDAEDALRGGADRVIAVHIGVESAVHVRVAGRARVHRRQPKLAIVPRHPQEPAESLTRSDHWGIRIGLIVSAALIGAAIHLGMLGLHP